MKIVSQTVTHLLWTTFPSVWKNIELEKRVRIAGATDAVMGFNYSINFYIHFIANKDIREEVIAKFKFIKGKIVEIFLCK